MSRKQLARLSMKPRPTLSRRRRSILAWIVIALAFSWPGALRAQVRGVVVDSQGQPIEGVRLELWAPLKRLETQQSAAAGQFEFSRGQADSATAVIASRLGYRTVNLPLGRADGPLTIRMDANALQLQGISVTARSAALCPNRDEQEARALWAAAAATYDRAYEGMGIVADLMTASGQVLRSRVGMVDETALRHASRGTSALPRSIEPRTGYGYRVQSSLEPDYVSWHYKELGSHQAQHFIDPSFGLYNTLSVRARTAEGVVLAFCSRNLDRQAVGIEGTLTLSPANALLAATWTFKTPRPEEEAGGEVTFVPPGRGNARAWLVPATSLYWRALVGRPQFAFQRWERYNEWVMAPSGSSLHLGRTPPPTAP
jgi:hypothetical protein